MFNTSQQFPDPSLGFLRNGFYLNFINVVFFSSISSLITPAFIYVSKKNRFKDQQTLGFPIALQIYNTTLTMLCLQSIIIISIPALIILNHFDNPLVIILIAIITISYHFIDVLIQIQLVLLILLASQRLLLFFIPGTEKFISFSKVSINRFVIFLFITINVKDLIFQLCLTILENRDWAPFKMGRFGEVGEEDLFKFRLSSYLLLNSLLFLTSILYIPMFINIWKMRNLRSVALFQPQKYVFYQIASILLAKLVFTIVLTVYFHSIGTFHEFPALCFKLLGYFLLTDCSVSPFMIQLTYLFCNKRNVDTLLSSPVGRAMKFIFCHNRGLYQVEPSVWATSNQTV